MLLCFAIFLFKIKTSSLVIGPYEFFKVSDENGHYLVLSLFLLCLLYLSLRYYQTLIKNDQFNKINREFEHIRNAYFFKKHIEVDFLSHGQRENEEFSDDPYYDDHPPFKTRITVDHDCSRIFIEKKLNFSWSEVTGYKFFIERIKIFILSLYPFRVFIFRELSFLEFIFPLILAFAAFLEIIGVSVSNHILNNISSALKISNDFF